MAATTIAMGSLLMQPFTALANVYSAQLWVRNTTPTGEPNTDYCSKAGMVDTARNWGASYAYTHGTGGYDCTGAVNVLPAGWIGVWLIGYMGGGVCGYSIESFSSSAVSGWQLWDTACSNPSGLQTFFTKAHVNIYLGAKYTGWIVGPNSPAANY